ncbi:MAG: hypothetical protein A3E88_02600 [Legionellales bacterium RIFCSPHIGHO2_12_FULL_35_11]|nr:MAG: hypothetical protein A3E88_02600 [Legionellales bacterium RIFCSPHIGHO2_12_FULL_35_11]
MKKYWKTLIGKCIYHSPTGVKVHQNLIYRWLTIESNIIQTLINRFQLSNASLLYIKAITFASKNREGETCLLGLGGCAIPHALVMQQSRITAIEINNDIIEIANKYFKAEKLKNLDIINADANAFLKNTDKKFQHLIIDIHDSSGFPKNCLNLDFFTNCKKVLCQGGTMTINLAKYSDFLAVTPLLNLSFPEISVTIPVPKTSNIVICKARGESILKQFTDTNLITKIIWDNTFGYLVKLK